MERVVILAMDDEWWVTFSDRRQESFETRREAEESAFRAAREAARTGKPVSVLILPTKDCLVPCGLHDSYRTTAPGLIDGPDLPLLR